MSQENGKTNIERPGTYVAAIKKKYEGDPRYIIYDLEKSYGNLTRMLEKICPPHDNQAQVSRERIITCIIEILSRPENEALLIRFNHLHQSTQSALWMMAQSNYFNTIARYKLPEDASPASIVSLGKFWLQNNLRKGSTPETSSEVKELRSIVADLEKEED